MNKLISSATKLMAGVEIPEGDFKVLTLADIIAKIYEIAITLRNISIPITVVLIIVAGVMWAMPSQRQGAGFGLIVRIAGALVCILLSVSLVQIVVNLFS